MAGVSIKNLTRRTSSVAGLPFVRIAKEVLPGWEISLVFVSSKKALELNKKLRGKNYVPNVLSYAVGNKSCEIIICPSVAIKQAPAYSLLPTAYCLLLFIHAVLHIKGWVHGANMDKCERKLLARFNETPNRNRNRHRHVPSKDGRSRGAL